MATNLQIRLVIGIVTSRSSLGFVKVKVAGAFRPCHFDHPSLAIPLEADSLLHSLHPFPAQTKTLAPLPLSQSPYYAAPPPCRAAVPSWNVQPQARAGSQTSRGGCDNGFVDRGDAAQCAFDETQHRQFV